MFEPRITLRVAYQCTGFRLPVHCCPVTRLSPVTGCQRQRPPCSLGHTVKWHSPQGPVGNSENQVTAFNALHTLLSASSLLSQHHTTQPAISSNRLLLVAQQGTARGGIVVRCARCTVAVPWHMAGCHVCGTMLRCGTVLSL